MCQEPRQSALKVWEERLKILSLWAEQFAERICFLILFAIVVIILMEVFFRKFPILKITWGEEAVQMLAVWLGLCAASPALRHGLHIGMNYLVDKIPSFRLIKGVGLFVKFNISCFLCISLIYGLILLKEVAIQTSPALQISMRWAYLAVPVGSLLLLIQTIYLMMVDLNDLRRGNQETSDE